METLIAYQTTGLGYFLWVMGYMMIGSFLCGIKANGNTLYKDIFFMMVFWPQWAVFFTAAMIGILIRSLFKGDK